MGVNLGVWPIPPVCPIIQNELIPQGVTMTELHAWQTFYNIVGSSAGALIGLQFVVMALISSLPQNQRNAANPEISAAATAFSTPTIVHFGTALVLSALLCAPWPTRFPLVCLIAAAGIFGLVYGLLITIRLRRQSAYRPEFEDWLFHAILPLAANAALAAAAPLVLIEIHTGLFLLAAVLLGLMLIGIHNAWDSATYHVFSRPNAG